MKTITLIFTVLTFSESLFAQACGAPATYYRFWQGFKLPATTQKNFEAAMPDYIDGTLSLYKGKGLNTYLAALPPAPAPAPAPKRVALPDSFGLIGFNNQASYDAVMASTEGIDFNAAQWSLFDQTKTTDVPVVNFDPLDTTLVELKANVAYNVLGGSTNWCSGLNLFYIGTRKSDVTPVEFRTMMATHLRTMLKTFKKTDLTGYVVLVTDDYEIAYMQWKNKLTLQSAYTSPAGKIAEKETDDVMNDELFTDAKLFKDKVEQGKFYSTLKNP